MTTEDDFQSALDACPGDWQCRLVFADWLEEQGDPRAEGYRAMARIRFHAGRSAMAPLAAIWNAGKYNTPGVCQLPDDWFALLRGGLLKDPTSFQRFNTRREAEDAAALAFARLPAKRRAQLLCATRAPP